MERKRAAVETLLVSLDEMDISGIASAGIIGQAENRATCIRDL